MVVPRDFAQQFFLFLFFKKFFYSENSREMKKKAKDNVLSTSVLPTNLP